MINNINPNVGVQQVQYQTDQAESAVVETTRTGTVARDRVDVGFDERVAFFPPVDLDRILSLTDEEFAELRAARFDVMAQSSQGGIPTNSHAELVEYLMKMAEVQDEALQGITQTL